MKKVLCGILLLATLLSFAPAAGAAEFKLFSWYSSQVCLFDDKPDYDTALFDCLVLELDSKVVANDLHMNAKGTITVNGSFKYAEGEDPDKTVTNGSASVALEKDMEKGKPLSYLSQTPFWGNAVAGGSLNGKKVSWSFDGTTDLQDGEATLPNFISTKDQLTAAVPYITLNRDSSKAITGFAVSMVMSDDTTTPVAVENVRLLVAFDSGTAWETYEWSDGSNWKAYAGAPLTNTLSEPIAEQDFRGMEVCVRKDGDDVAYRWLFFPSIASDEGLILLPPDGKSITTGSGKNTITLSVGEKIAVKGKEGCTFDYIFSDDPSSVLRTEGFKHSGTDGSIIANKAGTTTFRLGYYLNNANAHLNWYYISKPLEITVMGSR